MALKPPRLTVLRAMVLVAIAAVACELELWRRRIPHCRAEAARCERIAAARLRLAADHARRSDALRRDPKGHYNIRESVLYIAASWAEEGRARRAAERAAAFRRAVRYPWSPTPANLDDPMGATEPQLMAPAEGKRR